jgi:Lon protease-like protein
VVSRLPLFPLPTVAVPGLVMPLHVFEPRYRLLVQALTALPESALRRFGIIAVRPGQDATDPDVSQLYEIGCTTELREVTPHPDGRYDIVVVGQDRFRLIDIDSSATAAYPTGIVEFLLESEGEADLSELTAHIGELFERYRRVLHLDVTQVPDDPRTISYLIAAAMVLELPQRQALLEKRTTAERLVAEATLLRRERALIEAFGTLPATEQTLTAANPS